MKTCAMELQRWGTWSRFKVSDVFLGAVTERKFQSNIYARRFTNAKTQQAETVGYIGFCDSFREGGRN